MERRTWPKEISSNDSYTELERKCFTCFSKNEMKAWLLLDIDPVGLKNERVKMAVLICPNKGILSFSIHDVIDEKSFSSTIDIYTNMVGERIYNLLLESSLLIKRIGDKKVLQFPYRHLNVLKKSLEPNGNKCITPDFFIEERQINSLFDIDFCWPYSDKNCCISEEQAIAIVGKLAPEYTVNKPQVVKTDIEVVKENGINVEELPFITGKEIEYSTFLLDEEQVKYVNEMGTGHRVLLANAGAGKSVLLLSRAYRYASAHKEGKVLITCYNTNLSDAYRFKNGCANFGDNHNLYILTFHKLVKKIYKECLKKDIAGEFPTEKEIEDLLIYIKKGMVDLKFTAIFIDEVQIFTPLYLDICYMLLGTNKDSVFLLAGDLNQTVRTQSRRGDAPWKKIDGGRLNFRGRVKYISKNYRNSPQISRYLNGMLAYMNTKLSQNGLIDMQEFDYNIFGDGPSKNIALVVKRQIPRMNICENIIKAIDEITHKHKVGYSDIAILFPYKDNRLLKYHMLFWLTSELKKNGIEYSLIFGDGQEETRTRYSKTSGVVISTIDSSLGLDFKAVILSGLYPYQFIYSEDGKTKKIREWQQLKKLSAAEQENFKIQLRKIYTACSRARELLYVLSDIEKGCPFEDVLEDRSK